MRTLLIAIVFILITSSYTQAQYIVNDKLPERLSDNPLFPNNKNTNKRPQTLINLSGFAKAGFYYQKPTSNSNLNINNSIKWDAGIQIEFMHKANNKIEVGSLFALRGYTSNDYDEDISSYTNNNGQIEQAYVYFKSDIGKFSAGITDAVQNTLIPNIPNFGPASNVDSGINTADWSVLTPPDSTYNYTNISITKKSNKINYLLPKFNFVTLGISYTPVFTEDSSQGGSSSGNASIVLQSANTYENVVSASFNMRGKLFNSDLSIGGSYEFGENTPNGAIRITQRLLTIAGGFHMIFDKVSVGARVSQTKYGNNFTNIGFSGSTKVSIFSDIDIGAGYMQNKDNISQNEFSRLGFGVAYNLLQGVSIGGIYKFEKIIDGNAASSASIFGTEVVGIF